jgi:hypothetical protein
MSNLESHVPDLDRCRRMAAVPALRDAFKDSPVCWCEYHESHYKDRGSYDVEVGKTIHAPELRLRADIAKEESTFPLFPAPLDDEMLARLDCGGWNLIQRRGYGGLERWAVLVGDDDAGEAAWYRITDPNALADACLAAAGESK